MQALSVVDLSHHNPDPDFAAMKAAGIAGVFHKATEGNSYTDPKFAARKAAAQAAGMPFASYHFLHTGDIPAQVAHYLDVAKPAHGERVVIDHEADATIAELHQFVTALLGDARNLQVTLYSGHTIKEQLGNTRDDLLAGTALWISHYTTAVEPKWPEATWPVWSLWQYTDGATVKGISAPVDGNRFNGGEDALRRWFGPA